MDNGIACYNLGVNYLEGAGVPQDSGAAIRFLDKACNLKNDAACQKLQEIRQR